MLCRRPSFVIWPRRTDRKSVQSDKSHGRVYGLIDLFGLATVGDEVFYPTKRDTSCFLLVLFLAQ